MKEIDAAMEFRMKEARDEIAVIMANEVYFPAYNQITHRIYNQIIWGIGTNNDIFRDTQSAIIPTI